MSRPNHEAHSAMVCLPGRGCSGSGVSEVQAAFVTTLAAMYWNHADRASRLDRRCLQSRSGISTAYGGGGLTTVAHKPSI
jgi:hypothetical protein